ncbi:hypothetical protein [Variovorax sp. dw_954]|uniref:hypothetical protein n=1 Tax=Variovorax sp. dw_954 TaxID=2720078 RepID=UPI001BD35D0F|nr:hypothetical protein [Variovorax sp. dw_954]
MKHHLLIAGTGRAGTTFLVQYLAACGLETQLSCGDSHLYDENAQAGLEDILLGQANAPYVCKSPWLFEFVERLLGDRNIAIDAVIIPMRSLVEAATSRVVNEMRGRYAANGMAEDALYWSTWATVPGGVVYSLNPIDQARVLAMGFHHLLHALVRHEVPVVFLDFPRLVEDAQYLYRSLHPVLGDKVDRKRALAEHARLAAPGKVRIGRELANVSSGKARTSVPRVLASDAFPSHDTLDRIALLRELEKARAATHDAQKQLYTAQAQQAAALASLDNESHIAQQLRGELAAAGRECARLFAELKQTGAALEVALAAQARSRDELGALLQALATATHEREFAEARKAQAEYQRDALKASTSWRITAPLRGVSTFLRGGTKAR